MWWHRLGSARLVLCAVCPGQVRELNRRRYMLAACKVVFMWPSCRCPVWLFVFFSHTLSPSFSRCVSQCVAHRSSSPLVVSASLILICIAQPDNMAINQAAWQAPGQAVEQGQAGHLANSKTPHRIVPLPLHPHTLKPAATAIRQRHLQRCLVSLKVPLCCLPAPSILTAHYTVYPSVPAECVRVLAVPLPFFLRHDAALCGFG